MILRALTYLTLAATLGTRSTFFGETDRVGGTGGDKLLSMDCGSGGFIVGVTASGGKDGQFGFNLVRRIRFTCRMANGSTQQTAEAVGSHAITQDLSSASVSCPTGMVIDSFGTNAGTYIDRLSYGDCISSTQNQSGLNINVGGDGGVGTNAFSCPATEALYRVDVRYGDTIDSMKGYCRVFVAPAALSVAQQIENSVKPNASDASIVKLPVGTTTTFTFSVTNLTILPTVGVGIVARTDLLGGGAANPPQFRLELLNPAGAFVTSKVFSNVVDGTISSVTTTFTTGTWKLRVTNLKNQIGTLEIRDVTAFVP
jgi:hypothetical protein